MLSDRYLNHNLAPTDIDNVSSVMECFDGDIYILIDTEPFHSLDERESSLLPDQEPCYINCFSISFFASDLLFLLIILCIFKGSGLF